MRPIAIRFALLLPLAAYQAQSSQADDGVPAPRSGFFSLGALPVNGRLQSIPHAVSDDGWVIVGESVVDGPAAHAFRWSNSTMMDLGVLSPSPNSDVSYATDVTPDGAIVVGASDVGGARYPIRWTQATGLLSLGHLPNTFYCDARGVSADGNVAVGRCKPGSTSSTSQAFMWTPAQGMVGLGFLPNPAYAFSFAKAVTPDGAVIVGQAVNQTFQAAFRWTASTGMVELSGLPGNAFPTDASGVSADGRVIIGKSGANAGIRWVEGAGAYTLGDLPGGNFFCEPMGVSADGSIVVGRSNSALGDEAFIWDEFHGMRNLRDLLTSQYGLNLAGWRLASAESISSDGRAIVGWGLNPSGWPEGWLARIPEPTTALLLGLGSVLIRVRRCAVASA